MIYVMLFVCLNFDGLEHSIFLESMLTYHKSYLVEHSQLAKKPQILINAFLIKSLKTS